MRWTASAQKRSCKVSRAFTFPNDWVKLRIGKACHSKSKPRVAQIFGLQACVWEHFWFMRYPYQGLSEYKDGTGACWPAPRHRWCGAVFEQVNIKYRFLNGIIKKGACPKCWKNISSFREEVQHLDHQAQQHLAFSCNEMLDVLKSKTKLSALQNLNWYLFLRTTPVSSCAKCIHGLARRSTPEFVKVQSL